MSNKPVTHSFIKLKKNPANATNKDLDDIIPSQPGYFEFTEVFVWGDDTQG